MMMYNKKYDLMVLYYVSNLFLFMVPDRFGLLSFTTLFKLGFTIHLEPGLVFLMSVHSASVDNFSTPERNVLVNVVCTSIFT